jgi:hypothetical protein
MNGLIDLDGRFRESAHGGDGGFDGGSYIAKFGNVSVSSLARGIAFDLIA